MSSNNSKAVSFNAIDERTGLLNLPGVSYGKTVSPAADGDDEDEHHKIPHIARLPSSWGQSNDCNVERYTLSLSEHYDKRHPRPIIYHKTWRQDWVMANVKTINLPSSPFFDEIYYYSLRMTWYQLLLWTLVVYLLFALIFAVLFFPTMQLFKPPIPDFFSLVVFQFIYLAGVGTGEFVPTGLGLNLLLSIVSLMKVVLFAVITTIILARFARPVSRIRVSKSAVIGLHSNQRKLLFRISHLRRETMINCRVEVTLSRNILLPNGRPFRQNFDLPLVRAGTPNLMLPFTIQHQIDESSPLKNDTPITLFRDSVTLFVVVSAIDSVTGSMIWHRQLYNAEDIHFDAQFVDMMSVDDEGYRICDYENMDKIEQQTADNLTSPPASAASTITSSFISVTAPTSMKPSGSAAASAAAVTPTPSDIVAC